MIIRIRLKDHPDKYVGKQSVLSALHCDDRRLGRPAYYRGDGLHAGAFWFVPEHRANSWTTVQRLKTTLTQASQGWHKWHETTWTAYEVVHLDTGKVEPLDVFLLPFRGDLPDPEDGHVDLWKALRDEAQQEAKGRAETHYAIQAARDLIPVPAPQRQDSTTDQLLTVLEMAQLAGCYDARDLILETLMPETM